MNSKIRVVQYGMGPIGRSIAQLVLEREGLILVGAIDIDPAGIDQVFRRHEDDSTL